MHEKQIELLKKAQEGKLRGLTLRQMGKFIDTEHPNTVRFHLQKLIDKGFVDTNYEPIAVATDNFYHIPILGSANCGVATFDASDNIQGYLPVSKTLLNGGHVGEHFALRATGNSMNKSNPPITDGDYVLVKMARADLIQDGDYVVTLFGEQANIKKLQLRDDLALFVSESTQNYPPIVATREDFESGIVNIRGKIIKVISTHD